MSNITRLDESKEKLNKLRESQKELLQEDEDAFAAVVPTLSVKQIEEMSDDELLAFNNYEEGKYYIGEPDFETKEDLVEYIRSVMVYLVQSYEFSIEMDNSIKEINDLTKETNDAIKEFYGFDKLDPNVSSIDIIEKAISDGLSKAEEAGDITKYAQILQSQETFNETFTLDRIKNLYKTLDPENLKKDAQSDRSVTIYKNYVKVQQKLGSQYDLVQVNDLEQRFLPEEYHSLNNLFIIAVIKYISKSMKDGRYSSDTAFFVSQLTTNLFLLHLGKMPKDKEEILLANIKEFLDMVR
jgi:hypothetical protein